MRIGYVCIYNVASGTFYVTQRESLASHPSPREEREGRNIATTLKTLFVFYNKCSITFINPNILNSSSLLYTLCVGQL